MGPTARRLQPIADFVSNGVLHYQDTSRINAHSRIVECNSERLMQAPDVFLDRGSGDSARQDRAPVRVLCMKLAERISAHSQFNLTCTLGEARMLRAIIKNETLRQTQPQLKFTAA
jgi:hypothetical protein